MAKTIEDLSNEIAQLKEALTKGAGNPSEVTYPVPHPDQKNHKGDFVDRTKLVSELKASLVGDAPKLLTEEAAAASPWVKQIGDIHKDTQKGEWTDYLEGMGLSGVAAGVEKIYEGENFSKIWPYFASALGGLLVPVIGLVLLSNFTNLQRRIQNGIIDAMAHRFPSLTGRTVALNNGGTRPGLVSRTELQQREDRAGGGLAAIPQDANFGPLRRQLQLLNPHLETFNQHAPAFSTNYRKLPSSRSVTKIAIAVKKLKESLVGVDANEVDKLAKAVKEFPQPLPDARKLARINKVVKDADPQAMKDVAKGAGKLVGVQQHLQPGVWQALPKARTLSAAAKSAERLAKAGREVGHAFDALKLAASQATSVIGPPSGS